MLFGMSLVYGLTAARPAGRGRLGAGGPRPGPGADGARRRSCSWSWASRSRSPRSRSSSGRRTPTRARRCRSRRSWPSRPRRRVRGLLQLMFVAFIEQHEFWVPIFAFLSIATMTLGNLVALQQRQLVRLLAYSGIAQAGYILLPFAPGHVRPGREQAAFAAATAYILDLRDHEPRRVRHRRRSERSPRLLLSDFAGVVRVAPFLAVGMTLFMVSLAGVPPAAGFWAKILIFAAAIDHGGCSAPASRGHGRELGDHRLLLRRGRPCGSTGRRAGPGPVPAQIRSSPACHAHRAGRGDLLDPVSHFLFFFPLAGQ